MEVKKNYYDPELSQASAKDKPKLEVEHGIKGAVEHLKEDFHAVTEKS